MKPYTGVGSRETPDDVLKLMVDVAKRLRESGYVLRSGHAPGADQAFEKGAGDQAEIYLPWKDFEVRVKIAENAFVMPAPARAAFPIAAEHHPNWEWMRPGVRNLHARNVHQVLGVNLNDPSDFLICWTPEASGEGGTGQAIRVARANAVLVFDLGDPGVYDRLTGWVS